MKEWACVIVSHHRDIGPKIEEWEKNGWRFHSHEAVGTPTLVNHYLLFESGNNESPPQAAKAAVAAAATAAD